jgi:hypothetical protein
MAVGSKSRKSTCKNFIMPARSLVLAITLFWVVTTGWLFYRDLWPRLRSGQPPPYTIDLADEALQKGPKIAWSIYRGNKKVGLAQTWLRYRDWDDTFELYSEAAQLDWGRIHFFTIHFQNLSGMYRVTRDGRLRRIVADATISGRGIGPFQALRGMAKAHVEGDVENERFTPQGWVELNGTNIDLPLEPVEVSSQGSVLNPLHPISRVTGLRPGQRWHMPLVNPLNDSLMALLKKDPGAEILLQGRGGVRILQAEVLPDRQLLSWKGHDVPCLVIEYHGDDLTARTWVREENGLVLRQEFSFWGDQVVMVRDDAGGTP